MGNCVSLVDKEKRQGARASLYGVPREYKTTPANKIHGAPDVEAHTLHDRNGTPGAGKTLALEFEVTDADLEAPKHSQLGGQVYNIAQFGPPIAPNEEERKLTVNALGLRDHPKCEHLDALVQFMWKYFDASFASITFFSDNDVWIGSGAGLAADGPGVWKYTACPWVFLAQNHQVLVIEDFREDARFSETVWPQYGLQSHVSAPLVASNGHRLGTICFGDFRPRRFNAQTCRILNNLAEIAVREIERHAAIKLLLNSDACAKLAYAKVQRNLSCLDSCVAFVDNTMGDWAILYANATWCATVKHNAKELPEILHPQRPNEHFWEGLTELSSTGKSFRVEHLCLRSEFGWHSTRGSEGQLFSLTFRPAARDLVDDDTVPIGIPTFVDMCLDTMARQGFFVTLTAETSSQPLANSLALQASERDPVLHVHTPSSQKVAALMATSEAEDLELYHMLGRGAFAAVYYGEWHAMEVAVKVLDSWDMTLSEWDHSLLEIELAERMQHPNIVRTYQHQYRTGGPHRDSGSGSNCDEDNSSTATMNSLTFTPVIMSSVSASQGNNLANAVSWGNALTDDDITSHSCSTMLVGDDAPSNAAADSKDLDEVEASCKPLAPGEEYGSMAAHGEGPLVGSDSAGVRDALAGAEGSPALDSESQTDVTFALGHFGSGAQTEPSLSTHLIGSGATSGGGSGGVAGHGKGLSQGPRSGLKQVVQLAPDMGGVAVQVLPEAILQAASRHAVAGHDYSGKMGLGALASAVLASAGGPAPVAHDASPTSVLVDQYMLGSGDDRVTSSADVELTNSIEGQTTSGVDVAGYPDGTANAAAVSSTAMVPYSDTELVLEAGVVVPGCGTGRSQRDAMVLIIMEYCDMGTLQDAVDQGRFLDQRSVVTGRPVRAAVLATALEIASALQHLHKRGVVHADLTATNVLLTSHGTEADRAGRGFVAKVADFGMSHHLGVLDLLRVNSYGAVTHIAPEVIAARMLSRASDMYALGVLMWQMWTSSRPWLGLRHVQVVDLVVHQRRQLIFPPDTPADLCEFAMVCMSYEPERRPTAAEACERLRDMADECGWL